MLVYQALYTPIHKFSVVVLIIGLLVESPVYVFMYAIVVCPPASSFFALTRYKIRNVCRARYVLKLDNPFLGHPPEVEGACEGEGEG